MNKKYDSATLQKIEAEVIAAIRREAEALEVFGEYWAVLDRLKMLRALNPQLASSLEEEFKADLAAAREAVWRQSVEEAEALLNAYALLAAHAAGRVSNTGVLRTSGLRYRIVEAEGEATIYVAGEAVASLALHG